jgi:hypothetical protein
VRRQLAGRQGGFLDTCINEDKLTRRIKRKGSGSSRIKRQTPSREQVNIIGGTRCIVERAQNLDARIVTVGPLVLFSTETGDAWLDPEDGLALCLAREGEEQLFTIVETSMNFSVEWSASYRIDGDRFAVIGRLDRVQTFFGYPTAEISRAVRRAE